MQLVKGKIGLKWDDVIAEIDNKKISVNIKSLGNRNYYIGEQVEGIIIRGVFNICTEYHSLKKEKWLGFISRDNTDEDFIEITLASNRNPRKTIRVNRKEIENY